MSDDHKIPLGPTQVIERLQDILARRVVQTGQEARVKRLLKELAVAVVHDPHRDKGVYYVAVPREDIPVEGAPLPKESRLQILDRILGKGAGAVELINMSMGLTEIIKIPAHVVTRALHPLSQAQTGTGKTPLRSEETSERIEKNVLQFRKPRNDKGDGTPGGNL